jgi:PKD repeat protein
MVVAGSGNTLKCYRFEGGHAPVGDFTASDYLISANTYVHFTDQSSFQPSAWHWEFPGGSPSVSTDRDPQFILYENPGVYDVTLVVSNGLGSDTVTKQCLIAAEVYAGADDHSPLPGHLVFPNPADRLVTIKSDSGSAVSIFSSLGKTVYRDEAVLNERKVDVSAFPAGVYLVIFYEDNPTGKSAVNLSKLIINH